MATIHPFRGYRFSPEKVPDVSKAVTQPYDKISPALRADYLQRSPFNIARVIKNENYRQAGRYLDRWIGEGVLVQESQPAFYVYEQAFSFEGTELSRLGFIGLIALDDEDLAVKGHEHILDKPLEDRLNLIRATEANEGLVFTLFSDPERSVERALQTAALSLEPLLEVSDDFGVRNRVWAVHDGPTVSAVQASLKDKPLYIADGHHRFQTSVYFNRECSTKGWKPSAPESFDKRLIALFNMESEGMRILATHRAIRNIANLNLTMLLQDLRDRFEVESLPAAEALFSSLDAVEHSIGLVSSGRQFFCLKPKEGVLEDPGFMEGVTGPCRGLDVNLLHEGILRPLLGLGPGEVASQDFVDYFRDRNELLSALFSGSFQLAFVLRPTSLQQVKEVSEFGAKMPQKSTDFYPKLLTGLVLMKMRIERGAS